MENNMKFLCVGKGVIRAVILTVVCLLLYSVITTYVDVSGGITSVVFVVLTCISVMFGSIYAAKKSGSKGWLMGILVAIFYMLILYVLSIFNSGSMALDTQDLTRCAIALVVGALSGMLGINL